MLFPLLVAALVQVTPFTMALTQIFDVAGPYRISVSLPAAYDTGDARFPVVYVLDGDWYFGLAASTVRLLEAVQEMPPVIIVSIGYGGDISHQRARRVREFTPGPVEGLEGSGHAGEFFDALQKQLLPAIESRYRTNGDRTLVGHSLGGLFATYAMTRAPGMFQRVVIGSPALRNAGPVLIKTLSAQTTLPPRIFLGLAEGDFPVVRDGYEQLRRWLAVAPATVRWSSQEFAGMTHQSVIGPLFARALPWVFHDK
jgi:predicted alpha/beta superfamily hydrolase